MITTENLQHSGRISGAQRYPIPTQAPTYNSDIRKISGDKRWTFADALEVLTVVISLVLTCWLGWVLIEKSASISVESIGWLVVFWGLMAYMALPRLHQLLTTLYVPDYFISRTRTADGLLGDPVNLALEGTAEDIHAAMRRAGWVKADDITLASSWGIITSSVLRRSYPEAPVSNLFLFGRKQAFAYQQEVDGNALQRHHVRFWPVPHGWILPGGHRVSWLAAGTYDRAVGLSLFTGQVTHKIDANIDLERDYIINTVRFADPECRVDIIEDFSTAYHHRNGGGDEVHTDGDLPVLDVTGAYERNEIIPNTTKTPSHDTRALHVNAQSTTGTHSPSRPKRRRSSQHSVSVEHAAQSHVPPLSFLVTGILYGLVLLAVGFTWVAAITGGINALEDITLTELVLSTLAVILCLILWGLTAARRRWARLALTVIAIADTVQNLLGISVTGEITASAVIYSGVAVLTLWAISSDAMREWVSPRAREESRQRHARRK